MMIEKYIKKARVVSTLLTWVNIYMAVLFFLFYMDISIFLKVVVNLCMIIGYYINYKYIKEKERKFDDTLVMNPVFFIFGAAALILSTFYNTGACAIMERVIGIAVIAAFLYNMYLSSYINYLGETNSFEASNINRSFKNHNVNYLLWILVFAAISVMSLFLPYKAIGNVILNGMRMLFGYLFRNKKQQGGSVAYESVEEKTTDFTVASDGESAAAFWGVLIIIFISTLILMLYFMVRKIKEYKTDGRINEYTYENIPNYETVEDIPHGSKIRNRKKFSDSLEGKIRFSFAKAVRSVYGKNVEESFTPDELIGKYDENDILRNIYEKVRYSKSKVTANEAELAEDAAKSIKRTLKKGGKR